VGPRPAETVSTAGRQNDDTASMAQFESSGIIGSRITTIEKTKTKKTLENQEKHPSQDLPSFTGLVAGCSQDIVCLLIQDDEGFTACTRREHDHFLYLPGGGVPQSVSMKDAAVSILAELDIHLSDPVSTGQFYCNKANITVVVFRCDRHTTRLGGHVRWVQSAETRTDVSHESLSVLQHLEWALPSGAHASRSTVGSRTNRSTSPVTTVSYYAAIEDSTASFGQLSSLDSQAFRPQLFGSCSAFDPTKTGPQDSNTPVVLSSALPTCVNSMASALASRSPSLGSTNCGLEASNTYTTTFIEEASVARCLRSFPVLKARAQRDTAPETMACAILVPHHDRSPIWISLLCRYSRTVFRHTLLKMLAARRKRRRLVACRWHRVYVGRNPLQNIRSVIGRIICETQAKLGVVSTLSEFVISLINIRIRPDGVIEASCRSRSRFGLAEIAPASATDKRLELADFLRSTNNADLASAISSVQQGHLMSRTIPINCASAGPVSVTVGRWHRGSSSPSAPLGVLITETSMGTPTRRSPCVSLAPSGAISGSAITFSEKCSVLTPDDGATQSEVFSFVIYRLAKRYLMSASDRLCAADNCFPADIVVESMDIRSEGGPLFAVQFRLGVKSRTDEARVKTAVSVDWYQFNRGVLSIDSSTASVHYSNGARFFEHRDIGWLTASSSVIGEVVPLAKALVSDLPVGGRIRLVIIRLEISGDLFVLIPGSYTELLFATDLVWSRKFISNIKSAASSPGIWTTSAGLSWDEWSTLVQEHSFTFASASSLPFLFVTECHWHPLQLQGICRPGTRIPNNLKELLLTSVTDLRSKCNTLGNRLGFSAHTQNVNGLIHRLGLSSSKASSDRSVDYVMNMQNIDADSASFTETHQPSVLGYHGSPQTFDCIDDRPQFSTNVLEPGVVDFFRGIGFDTVIGSGASMRRMGVLSGIKQVVEKVWTTYDMPDFSDFERGCLRTNARIVAFVLRTDTGHILRVSIYAPNSGGTSASGSKLTCTRMHEKLVAFQKISIFIQMVQGSYPDIQVIMDGDMNTIHEGLRQGRLTTMSKSRGVKETRHEDHLLHEYGMSGCTKSERLALRTLKETCGLLSAFDTSLVSNRVSSDNRTAGLSNFVTTDQIKHSMRLPLWDAVGTIDDEGNDSFERIAITEDDCLGGRELVSMQVSLDHVLHTSNVVVDHYDISPRGHPAESVGRGSDHRDTVALCLNVSATLWSDVNVSAHLGTHPSFSGLITQTKLSTDSSVPYPLVQSPQTKAILFVRMPSCVVMQRALLSFCGSNNAVPGFSSLLALWQRSCVSNQVGDSVGLWDWRPRHVSIMSCVDRFDQKRQSSDDQNHLPPSWGWIS
jgi:hypothetical protein